MSGKDRIATAKQVKEWTEERRRRASERMKAQWASDPEFAAKSKAGLQRGNKSRWENPEFAARRLDELAYQRCSPAYVNFPRVRLNDPVQAEKHAALLARLNSDPILIERKRSRVKRLWADPKYRARMAEKNRRAADKKRGFRVPPSMWAEYKRLQKGKALGAQEAGRILGLVK